MNLKCRRANLNRPITEHEKEFRNVSKQLKVSLRYEVTFGVILRIDSVCPGDFYSEAVSLIL
jgi:hypothetical protein